MDFARVSSEGGCVCVRTPEEVLVRVCVWRGRGCLRNDAGTENFTTRESNAGVKCRDIEKFYDSASHTVRR